MITKIELTVVIVAPVLNFPDDTPVGRVWRIAPEIKGEIKGL